MTKVIITGEMYYADLSIGGGPIIPPTQPQPPLGIWGPNDPRPTNPIAGPGRPPWWGMAQDPGYSPPWARPGGPVDPGYGIDIGTGPVRPAHPIYFPPANLPVDPGYSPPWAQVPDLPDTVPPAQGSGGEPIPVVWKTGWTPGTGWVVVGVPTGPVPTPST